MLVLLAKSQVKGYTKGDGTFVRPHSDKRKTAAPVQHVLTLREPTGGDQVIGFPYASGMSRKRDMAAAIESPAGVGTEVGELSKPGIAALAAAVAAGKPVFVDSGAFNAFKGAMRAGKPEDAFIDFEPVFAKYDELSHQVGEACGDEHWHNRSLLMLVGPDVIGDQVKTLELVELHRERILSWIDAGHEVIIPFQRGPIRQYEAYLRVRDALEDMPFVVGIPSAAAAMTTADFIDLVSHDYKPDRLHILGAVQSDRWAERMSVIRDYYINDVPGVTTDANVMRSKLHELGGLQGQEKFDKIKNILARVVPTHYGGERPLAKSEHEDAPLAYVAAPRPVSFHAAGWKPPTLAQAESGNYFKPEVKWRGLTIKIETPAGRTRRGKGWETLMWNDYGYITRSEAVDGDEVDVYLGPLLESAGKVYVIHQRRFGDWEAYDEDKCMVGFADLGAAVRAYLKHYDDERFLGPITEMDVEDFVAKVKATNDEPAMIKSVVMVQPHARDGHMVMGYARDGGGSMSRLQAEALASIRHAAQWKHRPGAGAEKRKMVQEQFDRFGDGFELRNQHGNTWAVLMPDATHHGKYRYQVFDRKGLAAHYTYNSREEALRGAMDAGFSSPDLGALERLAPHWVQQIEEMGASGAVEGSNQTGASLAKALELAETLGVPVTWDD